MFTIVPLQSVTRRSIDTVLKLSPIFVKCLSTEPMVREEPLKPALRKPPRVRSLKIFKENFIEDLFVGKMDPERLEYPEVLDNDEISSINIYASSINKFMQSTVVPSEVHSKGTIPKNVMNQLIAKDLFALRVPYDHDGMDLTETESAMVQEALASESSVSRLVAEIQDLGVKAIRCFGSEQQKEKYLRAIKNGESLPCIAYAETGGISDAISFKTHGVLTSDGQRYVITGSKSMVYNAVIADFIILFASTAHLSKDGDRSQGMTAFLIDKSSKGVTVGKPMNKIGLKGVDVCDVSFNNVEVPVENILGQPNKGRELFHRVVATGKFNNGAQCCSLMRTLISNAVQHCLYHKMFGTPLAEWDYALGKLGKMTCATYAVESMTYMLTGNIDNYENPDVFVESLVVKIAASEALQFVIKEYLQLVGSTTFCKDDFLDKTIRDAHFHSVFEETNDQLKVMVSLMGLKHAGMSLHDTVTKLRNPFMHPMYIFKRLHLLKDHGADKNTLKLGLAGYLHPSLQMSADTLEYCISRLYFITEFVLARHGNEVSKRHLELIELCDIVVSIYTSAAALSRASRSYCIGLRNADMELCLANACQKYHVTRVRARVQKLIDGPVAAFDTVYKSIGELTLSNKGYLAEHPTVRNF